MEEWREQQPWAEATISKFDMFDYCDAVILILKTVSQYFWKYRPFLKIQTNFRGFPQKVCIADQNYFYRPVSHHWLRPQKVFHRVMFLREQWSILKRNGIIYTFQGLLLMMVKGNNRSPTMISFASTGTERRVLTSFSSGALAIYRQRSIIVISSRYFPRVVAGSYGLMLGINGLAWFAVSACHVLHRIHTGLCLKS